MKKLAPDIIRQRLLIEGFYSISVDEKVIKNYFQKRCLQLIYIEIETIDEGPILECFVPKNEHLSLTFRHWAGVRLYTSSYEFAEPCVFVKQSIGPIY